MKKILISLTLALLLVTGYFVGEAQFSSSGTDIASYDPAVGSQLYDTKTQSGRIARKSADSNLTYSSSAMATNNLQEKKIDSSGSADVIAEPGVQCQAIDCMPIGIGDPKGTKIVKSGSIEVSIKKGSVGSKYDDVVELIPNGGYIESSESTPTSSTLMIRIPADKLDSTLVALRKLGNVKSESIGSTDHTWQSVDYDARLKIMREREAVLNELLKKAASASETASIQEQIFALRTDIETLQGQKDVLESQVALSTLTVTLTEKGAKAATPEKRSMIAKAWETSAGALLTSVGGIMIVFTSLFPFMVLAAVLFFAGRRYLKRDKNARFAPPAAATAE